MLKSFAKSAIFHNHIETNSCWLNIKKHKGNLLSVQSRISSKWVICLAWHFKLGQTMILKLRKTDIIQTITSMLQFLCFSKFWFVCCSQQSNNRKSLRSQGYTFVHTGTNFHTVLVKLEAGGSWSSGGWLNVKLTSSASPSSSSSSSWFSGSTAILFRLKYTKLLL